MRVGPNNFLLTHIFYYSSFLSVAAAAVGLFELWAQHTNETAKKAIKLSIPLISILGLSLIRGVYETFRTKKVENLHITPNNEIFLIKIFCTFYQGFSELTTSYSLRSLEEIPKNEAADLLDRHWRKDTNISSPQFTLLASRKDVIKFLSIDQISSLMHEKEIKHKNIAHLLSPAQIGELLPYASWTELITDEQLTEFYSSGDETLKLKQKKAMNNSSHFNRLKKIFSISQNTVFIKNWFSLLTNAQTYALFEEEMTRNAALQPLTIQKLNTLVSDKTLHFTDLIAQHPLIKARINSLCQQQLEEKPAEFFNQLPSTILIQLGPYFDFSFRKQLASYYLNHLPEELVLFVSTFENALPLDDPQVIEFFYPTNDTNRVSLQKQMMHPTPVFKRVKNLFIKSEDQKWKQYCFSLFIGRQIFDLLKEESSRPAVLPFLDFKAISLITNEPNFNTFVIQNNSIKQHINAECEQQLKNNRYSFFQYFGISNSIALWECLETEVKKLLVSQYLCSRPQHFTAFILAVKDGKTLLSDGQLIEFFNHKNLLLEQQKMLDDASIFTRFKKILRESKDLDDKKQKYSLLTDQQKYSLLRDDQLRDVVFPCIQFEDLKKLINKKSSEFISLLSQNQSLQKHLNSVFQKQLEENPAVFFQKLKSSNISLVWQHFNLPLKKALLMSLYLYNDPDIFFKFWSSIPDKNKEQFLAKETLIHLFDNKKFDPQQKLSILNSLSSQQTQDVEIFARLYLYTSFKLNTLLVQGLNWGLRFSIEEFKNELSKFQSLLQTSPHPIKTIFHLIGVNSFSFVFLSKEEIQSFNFDDFTDSLFTYTIVDPFKASTISTTLDSWLKACAQLKKQLDKTGYNLPFTFHWFSSEQLSKLSQRMRGKLWRDSELHSLFEESQLNGVKDFYSILNVLPEITAAGLKTHWKKRVLEIHPDRHSTTSMEEQAKWTELFKQEDAAYKQLLFDLENEEAKST